MKTKPICFSYLFENELVLFVELPGSDNMYSGQDSSTKNSSSHSDRQQSVDDIDEEHRPPNALWGTAGENHQNPENLQDNQNPDHQVAHNPHVVLVEAVTVAHDHQGQEESRGHRKHWDVGHTKVSVDTVEGNLDSAHHHQHPH